MPAIASVCVTRTDTFVAAIGSALPTDDVELMGLAAKYLEDDFLISDDLDVQTYVQLMLSAKQAAATRRALWVVA